jgi:hypothetical protein
MGAKEYESGSGHIWGAAFHLVMAHSHLARVLKLMNHFFLKFSHFLSGRSKLWILNQQIEGHACKYKFLSQISKYQYDF